MQRAKLEMETAQLDADDAATPLAEAARYGAPDLDDAATRAASKLLAGRMASVEPQLAQIRDCTGEFEMRRLIKYLRTERSQRDPAGDACCGPVFFLLAHGGEEMALAGRAPTPESLDAIVQHPREFCDRFLRRVSF